MGFNSAFKGLIYFSDYISDQHNADDSPQSVLINCKAAHSKPLFLCVLSN